MSHGLFEGFMYVFFLSVHMFVCVSITWVDPVQRLNDLSTNQNFALSALNQSKSPSTALRLDDLSTNQIFWQEKSRENHPLTLNYYKISIMSASASVSASV